MVTSSTKGLGENSAMALAKAGANVTVCGRNTEDLKRVSDAIKALGRDSGGFVLDVRELTKNNPRILFAFLPVFYVVITGT